MQKIAVASKNPVKIQSALLAFQALFPAEEFEAEGIETVSGVADQPMTEEETIRGATNRAERVKAAKPEADFWVGMEGGVEERNGELEAFAWMVVLGKDGLRGKGRTGTFFPPEAIARLVREGVEMGHAADIVFKGHNHKYKGASVGLLTENVIDRTNYYVHATILALIPFKNPELYQK